MSKIVNLAENKIIVLTDLNTLLKAIECAKVLDNFPFKKIVISIYFLDLKYKKTENIL